MRAVTYSRKSSVDRARQGKSVADQQREARAEVERRGWVLLKELSDDGIPASRFARTTRPGFEEVLSLIEAGEVDAVVMSEQSRATRSLAVLGALLEACAAKRVLLVVGGTEVDPSRPEGFLVSAVVGAVDASESERIRARVLRGARGSAVAGRPHGRAVYGYVRQYDERTRRLLKVVPHPQQAAVVVEVIDRVLAGQSMRSITNDLNERGILSPTGKPWHMVTLRRIAMSPTYAGLRVHRGQVVGDADWPALISKERHLAVCARLSDAARVSVRPGAERHLLSGTALCWKCGGPLGVVLDRRHRTYTCRRPGCFAVSVGEAALDEYVTEAVLERLSRPAVARALAASDEEGYQREALRLEALVAKKAEIGHAMAAGMDVTAAQVALADLASQVEAAQTRLKAMVRDPLLASVVGDVRAAWKGLNADQRATVVRLVVTPVIHRSQRPKGSRGFAPERVELRWRT